MLHVLLRAAQVRLEHDPHGVAELGMERLPEELQGPLGVVGLFHVDPHKRAVRLRRGDDGAQVVDARRRVDIQPHLCELDRDVRGGAGRLDAIEGVEVGVACRASLGSVVHGLPQEVEARRDPGRVELFERRDARFHRLTRDEARGELPGQPVGTDELEDARLLAEPEEAGADHQG